MEDEVVIVKGTWGDQNRMRLELIRKTFNNYLEKTSENPKWTMNMTAYVQDVYFLLWLIGVMSEEIGELNGKRAGLGRGVKELGS